MLTRYEYSNTPKDVIFQKRYASVQEHVHLFLRVTETWTILGVKNLSSIADREINN